MSEARDYRKNKLKVKELFAFVAENEEGEGLMAMQMGGMMMPLVAADVARVEMLKPFAKKSAEASGIQYEIRHFVFNKVVEE